MSKRDFLWVLAFPVYFLVNSFRHELAHALSVTLEGAQLLQLSFWPTLAEQGGILLDAVIWEGPTTWMTSAMPYLFDVVTYVVFFYFCMAVPFSQRWVWINLVAVGLVSPLLNSGLNWMFLSQDIRALLQVFPPLAVDLYFCATITFYLVGLALVTFVSRTSMPSIPPGDGAGESIPPTGFSRG